MKSLTGFALFLAATFVTAGSASAQTHVEKANVPFAFTVGSQTVPAGMYTISSMSSPSLLAITSRDNKVALMTLGQPSQENPNRADSLVFDKVGDQYYLRDIHSSSSTMNIHFPATKAEKRARAQIAEAGLFVNDPVLIALN